MLGRFQVASRLLVEGRGPDTPYGILQFRQAARFISFAGEHAGVIHPRKWLEVGILQQRGGADGKRHLPDGEQRLQICLELLSDVLAEEQTVDIPHAGKLACQVMDIEEVPEQIGAKHYRGRDGQVLFLPLFHQPAGT